MTNDTVAGLGDYQQTKVYRWENKYVSPLDKSNVEYKNIQSVVDYVWSELGYKYSPKVHSTGDCSLWGTGSRTVLKFHQDILTPTWIILHELSHSLTHTLDGYNNGHGPEFVGMYMKVLDRFIESCNLPMLMATAKMSKVEFNIMAKPAFLYD